MALLPDHDPDTGEIRDGAGNLTEYSVTDISHALKRSIEERFGHVRVRGEISGFRGAHSSGHCYFSVKDEGAKLDAVIWRGSFARLRNKLQEGLEVIVTGKLTSYPGKSSYQIIVEAVEPAGVGALMALLEERRKKLAAEGLFEAARKRPLPYLPRVIGVITSPTGAVIRDILHRLNDRFPRQVIVWPVRVQGETAAAEVVAALNGFNAMADKPDVLIVARGGGSLEDLWPFNDEAIVRAVAASAIPVISAIGHETDTTLIDHVADWRAPTPTAAAEKAVPVRADLVAELASLEARQRRAIARVMAERKLRVEAAARALPSPDDVMAIVRQRLDALGQRLPVSLKSNLQRHAVALANQRGRLSLRRVQDRLADMQRRIADLGDRQRRALGQSLSRKKDRFASESKLLQSLSYRSVLARGFAVVRGADGTPLHQAASVKPGLRLTIEFSDGEVHATADKAKGEAAPRKPGQGSLF
jgi:exodeoxyribonuclease VII large subunit